MVFDLLSIFPDARASHLNGKPVAIRYGGHFASGVHSGLGQAPQNFESVRILFEDGSNRGAELPRFWRKWDDSTLEAQPPFRQMFARRYTTTRTSPVASTWCRSGSFEEGLRIARLRCNARSWDTYTRSPMDIATFEHVSAAGGVWIIADADFRSNMLHFLELGGLGRASLPLDRPLHELDAADIRRRLDVLQ